MGRILIEDEIGDLFDRVILGVSQSKGLPKKQGAANLVAISSVLNG